MALQIKSFHEVFNNLVDWTTARTDKITDFNVGSAIRTLYDAISIQFEEFYFAMKQNVLWAIENAVYESFGFELRTSHNSTGYVTVTFEDPLPNPMVFPVDTVFCTSAVYNYMYFESTEEIYAETGSLNVMIPVRCKTEGSVGNVPAGAITTIVQSNAMIASVTNDTSFADGADAETASERKKRFQYYIKTLARGTRDAVMYGCLEVEGVSGAWVDDSYIGYVKLYAHDAKGELPEDLRQAIMRNMENYRAAGIEIQVLPIVARHLDLSLRILIGNNYDVETYNELLYDLVIGKMEEYTVASNFYLVDIIQAIKSAYNDIVVNIQVLQGADTVIGENELVRPGNVVITCVNAKDWRN